MFRKCLFGVLTVCTLSAHAADISKIYNIELKESTEKSGISINTTIGSITPIQVLKNDNKDTDCNIKNNTSFGKEELNIKNKKEEGVTAIVYPISEKDGNVTLLVTYEKVNNVLFETAKKPTKISNDCDFYNGTSVSENTHVQWNGDIKLNEIVKVKLSDDKDLLIKVSDSSPKIDTTKK